MKDRFKVYLYNYHNQLDLLPKNQKLRDQNQLLINAISRTNHLSLLSVEAETREYQNLSPEAKKSKTLPNRFLEHIRLDFDRSRNWLKVCDLVFVHQIAETALLGMGLYDAMVRFEKPVFYFVPKSSRTASLGLLNHPLFRIISYQPDDLQSKISDLTHPRQIEHRIAGSRFVDIADINSTISSWV